ncbi:MAG: hypothetical protein M1832_004656 [Thelocarpon impressellum]|nr:MAG: hypothetical protein M1832_004656 [Thelocarpon impressellum]
MRILAPTALLLLCSTSVVRARDPPGDATGRAPTPSPSAGFIYSGFAQYSPPTAAPAPDVNPAGVWAALKDELGAGDALRRLRRDSGVPTAERDLANPYYERGVNCKARLYVAEAVDPATGAATSLGLSADERALIRPCLVSDAWRAPGEQTNGLVDWGQIRFCRGPLFNVSMEAHGGYESAVDCFLSCRDCLRDGVEAGGMATTCRHQAEGKSCTLSYR